MAGDWRLFVRGPDLTLLGEIDIFERFEAIRRFNAGGTWTLDMPANVPAAELLTAGSGIVVKQGAVVRFSGDLERPEKSWRKGQYRLTASGIDDTALLSHYLCHPEPTLLDTTASAYDTRTGPAETVMIGYVDANMGPSANAARRLAGLTLAADGARGSVVTGHARFDNLLDLLRQLALAGGDLGFRIVQVGSALEFQVYVPTDRTGTIIFSPLLGTVEQIDYREEAAEANWVIVAGGDQLTSRTFRTAQDDASISRYRRRELFRDRRDTTDLTDLAQTAAEEISKGKAKTGYSVVPTTGLAHVAYGDAYELGDKVTVVLISEDVPTPGGGVTTTLVWTPIMPGFAVLVAVEVPGGIPVPSTSVVEAGRIADVIREVHITLDRTGAKVEPTIGTPDVVNPEIFARFSNDLRATASRVALLERRY